MAKSSRKKSTTTKKATKKKTSSKNTSRKRASRMSTSQKRTPTKRASTKKTTRKSARTKKTRKIVVAGDVAIDWLSVSTSAVDVNEDDNERTPNQKSNPTPNWRLFEGTRMMSRPGGALLLARLVRLATDANVSSQHLTNLEKIPPDEVLHSMAELDLYPEPPDANGKKRKVYRVRHFGGFCGPAEGVPTPPAIVNDSPNADIVLLDDAGNGFREAKEVWPAALTTKGKKPIVILKVSRPLDQGSLWELLREKHADRLVVVITADKLRREAAHISRCLSWERTATDFVWQMSWNDKLAPLGKAAYLVVPLSLDGAILHEAHNATPTSRLYYEPKTTEKDFYECHPGGMIGAGSAFVAALAARIASGGLEAIGEGVQHGLEAARRCHAAGFGEKLDQLDFPGKEIFAASDGKDAKLADTVIPSPTSSDKPDPSFWCILNDHAGSRLDEIAYNMVRSGSDPVLDKVPMARFGFLKTVDRTEIESYRSICNLMEEYLNTDSVKRPLSIAVFGPPGSGKSFGVTQVAESIPGGDVKKIEFNVSQFCDERDLVSALHRVRDIALERDVPLVFFDEFDSAFRDERLGWLKYFLAPMQDGAFRDGESVHPIGKAIFVFAGGTSSSFKDFSEQGDTDTFKNAKGPDFVSRLRGYVDVLGPNPRTNADKTDVVETDADNTDADKADPDMTDAHKTDVVETDSDNTDSDTLYMIRRAIVLRTLLERKAKHIIDGSKRVRIDQGVLRAMIKIPKYKHGVRSMEAIIDMSILTDRTSFEQASLPPAEQLNLHVDADDFSKLVLRDVLLGAIAKAIHEDYVQKEKEKTNSKVKSESMKPWNELADKYKKSNRQQAQDIPEKLKAIGYDFSPSADKNKKPVKFTSDEVEKLAIMEHDRWMREREQEGWTYGKVKNRAKKITPDLVPWEKLDEEAKDKDRNPVRAIPQLMATAGFAVYKLGKKPKNTPSSSK